MGSSLYSHRRWRRLREEWLTANPLCAMCLQDGRVTPATVVDHVEPHKGDEHKFWHGPLQSLCKPHHDGAKKSEELTGRQRGCSTDGIPHAGW